MKIAILNNIFFPYERGGAEKIVTSQITSLQQAGHEIFLITTKPHGASPLETNTDFPIYRFDSQYFGLGGWPLFLRPAWQLVNLLSGRKYLKIKKLLAEQKPDLVISHNLMGLGFMIPLAIRQLNIPHEHWLHDIQLLHPSGLMMLGKEKDVDSLLARFYQRLTRYFFSSPARIISPSHWLMSEHINRGFFVDSEQKVTHLGPDKIPARTGSDQPNKVFLFVGQIEKHKGIFHLLSAWQKTTSPHRRLIVIGDGQKLNAARKVAARDGRISFCGRLNQAEIKTAMASASWLVVPSLCYENFPTVITEAHASGLPVIAAHIGGIPEMLQASDKSYPAGSESALTALLNA
jgi:glycosyltransferase involved in cell wall biosynthesis